MYSDTSKVTFIPKSPVTSIQQPTSISGVASTETTTAAQGIGILGWLGIMLFVATLIGAGGLYLYVGYFQSQNIAIIEGLKKKQSLIDTEFIANAEKLGARIGYAKELLQNQIYMSPFFEALHAKTLPAIQYDSFELVQKTPAQAATAVGSGAFQSVLRGKARSYEVIAQQSDVFATSPVLKTHFFSNFNVDTTSSLIGFELRVDLPEDLGHDRNLNQDLSTGSGTPSAAGARPSSLRRFIELFQPTELTNIPVYVPEPEQLPPLQ